MHEVAFSGNEKEYRLVRAAANGALLALFKA
jgi:hypothetical protein